MRKIYSITGCIISLVLTFSDLEFRSSIPVKCERKEKRKRGITKFDFSRGNFFVGFWEREDHAASNSVTVLTFFLSLLAVISEDGEVVYAEIGEGTIFGEIGETICRYCRYP